MTENVRQVKAIREHARNLRKELGTLLSSGDFRLLSQTTELLEAAYASNSATLVLLSQARLHLERLAENQVGEPRTRNSSGLL